MRDRWGQSSQKTSSLCKKIAKSFVKLSRFAGVSPQAKSRALRGICFSLSRFAGVSPQAKSRTLRGICFSLSRFAGVSPQVKSRALARDLLLHGPLCGLSEAGASGRQDRRIWLVRCEPAGNPARTRGVKVSRPFSSLSRLDILTATQSLKRKYSSHWVGEKLFPHGKVISAKATAFQFEHTQMRRMSG
jgi:hypothetical protein